MSILVLALIACDADCEDPARINGTYAAFHVMQNVSGVAPEGGGDTAEADAKARSTVEGYDDGLAYSLFTNGWSRWAVTWAQATGSVNITMMDGRERMGDPAAVDGQAFTWDGQLTEASDNCNALALVGQGQFTSSAGTIHNFKYTSDLSWQGDAIAGTFTYSEGYSSADGDAGAIEGAAGEVVLVLQSGAEFDTGF